MTNIMWKIVTCIYLLWSRFFSFVKKKKWFLCFSDVNGHRPIFKAETSWYHQTIFKYTLNRQYGMKCLDKWKNKDISVSMYFEVVVLFSFFFRELFNDRYLSVVGYRLGVNVVRAKEVVTQLILRYDWQLFRHKQTDRVSQSVSQWVSESVSQSK